MWHTLPTHSLYLSTLHHRFARNGTVTGDERFLSTSTLSIVAKQFIWNPPHCTLALASLPIPLRHNVWAIKDRVDILQVKNCVVRTGDLAPPSRRLKPVVRKIR
jgi:hypothetical protein